MPTPTTDFKVRLWYPFTATYETATYSLELRAPEIGNSETKARNQAMQRTRFGTTLVYDRGRNYNDRRVLQFRMLIDVEKAALTVFLDAVQWGSSKLMYEHYTGEQLVIRTASTEMRYVDTGYEDHNNALCQKVLWDFDIDILDLTNNSDELEGQDPVVSSALSLHLTNFDHPHNPATSITLASADGAKTVESFLVDSWDSIHWMFSVVNGASKYSGFIHVTNNNVAAGADATTTDVVLEPTNDPAGIGANITFTVTLSGAGATQTMTLKAASTTNGNTVKVRRAKL